MAGCAVSPSIDLALEPAANGGLVLKSTAGFVATPEFSNIVEEIVEWSDEMTTIVTYLATLGAVVAMAALIAYIQVRQATRPSLKKRKRPF